MMKKQNKQKWKTKTKETIMRKANNNKIWKKIMKTQYNKKETTKKQNNTKKETIIKIKEKTIIKK